MHGPKEVCVSALKKGYLLAISPGGLREALFSDETYPIMWGNRKGFAQVAIDAKVVSMKYHGREAKNANFLWFFLLGEAVLIIRYLVLDCWVTWMQSTCFCN